MVNTAAQAQDKARRQSIGGPQFGTGECLKRVRECLGVPAFDFEDDGHAPWAIEAWIHSKRKHPVSATSKVPAGVPVFWRAKTDRPGHIALSAGGGMCWSTDIKRDGWFDLVPITKIHDDWGLTLLGWTEDLNNVQVYKAPKPPTLAQRRDAMAADLLAAAKAHDFTPVFAARTLLRSAAGKNTGGRLLRINTARRTLKGMS